MNLIQKNLILDTYDERRSGVKRIMKKLYYASEFKKFIKDKTFKQICSMLQRFSFEGLITPAEIRYQKPSRYTMDQIKYVKKRMEEKDRKIKQWVNK